jgi:hypothetical protein
MAGGSQWSRELAQIANFGMKKPRLQKNSNGSCRRALPQEFRTGDD